MNSLEQFKIWLRYNPFTASLIVLSIVIAIISKLGSDFQLLRFLIISEYRYGLPEFFSGQVWRLFTPIIIHFGILHIVFNMLWLYDLGSAIEHRQGTRRLAILVLITSIIPNLAQFYWNGPLFGGMSGVVYGLMAYIWVQGKFNPRAGIDLHQNIALMMLLWFIICWMGLVGNVANMAHTIGLVTGAITGLIFSPQLWRKY